MQEFRFSERQHTISIIISLFTDHKNGWRKYSLKFVQIWWFMEMNLEKISFATMRNCLENSTKMEFYEIPSENSGKTHHSLHKFISHLQTHCISSIQKLQNHRIKKKSNMKYHQGIKHFLSCIHYRRVCSFPLSFARIPIDTHQLFPHQPRNSYTFSNSLKLSLSVSISTFAC